jgi:hypothetical protein
MDFDTYWTNLVNRVYGQKEQLSGPEEVVFRLTCIYGETMVDGIESYFERRCADFQRDMEVLRENGFSDIAADFNAARQALFGNLPLTESAIAPVLSRLLDGDEPSQHISEQISAIYDRLIDQLPRVLDVRDEIGVANTLFVASETEE